MSSFVSTKPPTRGLLSLAVLASFSVPVIAQSEVVVSASKIEQQVKDAIPHTTVITQKEIRDAQAPDLATLLRREAGFEMSQTGGVGSQTSLFMRGGRGNQTLVLIDGVRMQDAAFGSTALQHILLDQVERDEIVRGNVSSLYGAGAMGGVIQVFTKAGKGPPSFTGSATVGARGTLSANMGASGSFNDNATSYNLTASGFKTNGVSAIDPARSPSVNPDRDGYRNTAISGSLAHRLSAEHELGLKLYTTRGSVDYDSNFGLPTDTHVSRQALTTVQAYWQARFTQAWTSKLVVSQGVDDRTDTRNGAFGDRSKTQTRSLSWDNRYTLAPDQTLSAALEATRQALDNSFLANSPVRNNQALRVGYNGRFGETAQHALQANLRAERTTAFGGATTGFLGYGYDLTQAWRFTASVSNAFRAPTFFDLYGFGGDKNLKAEKSRSWEVGTQYASSAGLLRAVLFNTTYQDAITFVGLNVRNARKAQNRGLETSYSGQLAGIDLRAALTLQNPTEQEPGAQELQGVRRARVFGSFSAQKSFGALRIGGDLSASGARPDFDLNTFARKTLSSYEVLNLTARYDFTKNIYAAAKLENALNKRYQLVDGYNATPRGLFFTVGWQPQ